MSTTTTKSAMTTRTTSSQQSIKTLTVTMPILHFVWATIKLSANSYDEWYDTGFIMKMVITIQQSIFYVNLFIFTVVLCCPHLVQHFVLLSNGNSEAKIPLIRCTILWFSQKKSPNAKVAPKMSLFGLLLCHFVNISYCNSGLQLLLTKKLCCICGKIFAQFPTKFDFCESFDVKVLNHLAVFLIVGNSFSFVTCLEHVGDLSLVSKFPKQLIICVQETGKNWKCSWIISWCSCTDIYIYYKPFHN